MVEGVRLVILIQWDHGVFHQRSSLLESRRVVEMGIKKLREKTIRELAAQDTGRTRMDSIQLRCI